MREAFKKLSALDKILLIASILMLLNVLSICYNVNIGIDSYWMVRLGEYIVNNKSIPKTDLWLMHDNYPVIYQSWLFAVIQYIFYEIFNENMVYAFSLCYILIIIHTIAAYKYCGLFTDNKYWSALMSVICSWSLLWMLMARPSVVSSTISYIELIVLTRYFIKKDISEKKLYITLGILSIIQANIQAAAWLFLVVLVFPFIAQLIFDRTPLSRKEYNKQENTKHIKTSIKSILVLLVTGLINPYTYKAEIYLYLSRDISKWSSYDTNDFEECLPASTFSLQWKLLIVAIVILTISITKYSIQLWQLCLSLGTMLIATMQLRQSCMIMYGIAPLIITLSSPILNYLYSKQNDILSIVKSKLKSSYNIIKNTIYVIISIVIIAELIILPIGKEGKFDEVLKSAVDYLNDEVKLNNLSKDNLKILCDSCQSGYLQYYGFKTYFSNRNETLTETMSGKIQRTVIDNNGEERELDLLSEYVIYEYTQVSPRLMKDFFDYYDFDYAVVAKRWYYNYMINHPDEWESIDVSNNESGYYVFKHIRN